MKTIMLSLGFMLSVNVLFTQHSFEKLILDPEDQIINHITEDDGGSIILVGRIHNIDTYYSGGYIIKIDSLGEIIQEKIIQQTDTSSCMLFNIHYFNNYYYILGSHSSINPDTVELWYLKLNSQLDIENEKFLHLPSERWFSFMKSIIDSDTNIVITGYTAHRDTTGPSPIPYNHNPFFYKLSLAGDSLTSKFMNLPFKLTHSTDIIEKKITSGYFAYGNDFADIPGSGQRFELSKDFDSLDVDSIPYRLSGFYYSSAWLNDTSIIICGQGGPETTPSYSLNVLSHTEENIPVDYNYFKMAGDIRDHPALYFGVSKNEENIYVGGNSNFDYANPFWSGNDSWYHLIKINPDITPIWEYWYGGDAYYFMYSILATNDGGCVMVGNRYDDQTQYMERDIYIAKVNSDGLIVWTQEIPTDSQITLVYPNPGTSQLNIKTKKKDQLFELININGQVVIKQFLYENRSTINTESLNPGMYFYRLIDEKNKSVETGKWIKK